MNDFSVFQPSYSGSPFAKMRLTVQVMSAGLAEK